MTYEHLDTWQSRVFGLSLPLHPVRKFSGLTRGRLWVKFWDSTYFGSTKGPLFDSTHLILGDGSSICLQGLWEKGPRCPRRSSLEESISLMYSSEFVEDSAKVLLAPIVRQLDFTKRCLRMLQRYPEGVMGWLRGEDMKPFRVLVYEMFLEGA